METHRYQITQDDKDYILSNTIIRDKLRIECQDNNYGYSLKYSKDYTLQDLLSFGDIFNYTSSIEEIQNELNNAIESEQIRISNLGNYMEIAFNIQVNTYSQELTFQLPMKQELTPKYITSETTTAAPISTTVYNKEPIYTDIHIPTYETSTQQIQDYPYLEEGTPQQFYQNTQYDMGYNSPLDHDRIDKIERNTYLLRGENDNLRQRLNDLKMKMQILKKETYDIRGENGNLNMLTLELKKQYKNLLEAEGALREENDELRKENHELILKKNELEFYVKDYPNYDTVREVNIPMDEKRNRPTNVSKREKQFGGGYSSNTTKAYKQKGENTGYSSYTMGNNNYGSYEY